MQTRPLLWRTVGVEDWRVWDVTGAAQGGARGVGQSLELDGPYRELYLVRKVQKNVKEKIGAVEMT